MNDHDTLQSVEKRADEKLAFYIHLAVYILVNGLLIAINLIRSPGTYWFIWPLIGWGIGVLLHGLRVFAFGGESELRKRMIAAELKKRGRHRDERGTRP